MIENSLAIDNLNEIASLPNLDLLLIGPYYLSASYGCLGDFNADKMLEALSIFKKVCSQTGLALGYHIVHPDKSQLACLKSDGFSFFPLATDAIFLNSAIKSLFNEID